MTQNIDNSVQPEQVNVSSFGSLDDLLNSAQEQEVTVEVEQPVEYPVEYPSLNQNYQAVDPLPEPVKQVVDFDEKHTPAHESPNYDPSLNSQKQEVDDTEKSDEPSLESELARDVAKAKQEGDTVEIRDVILSVMREIAEEIKNSGPDRSKIKDILNNIAIDPNNINIVSKDSSDPLAAQSQLSILEQVNSKPYFPIIALKSGYRANMTALNNNEKIMVRNIRGSVWDQTQAILRLIYSKVQSTSVGKLTYQRFLEITAEEDYDTLLYGIYHATFPEPTEYLIGCPHCGEENRLKLSPNNLVEVIDRDRATNYVQEVLANYTKGEEFLKDSLVAKRNRIVLPTSKMVIELLTPSLQHMLDNLRISDSQSHLQPELVVLTKHMAKIYVMDINAANNGVVKYHEIENRDRYAPILNDLSAEDLSFLRKEIARRISHYRVEYQIPKFNCAAPKCGKTIANSSIDIMRLVFFAIAGEAAEG